MIKSLKNKMLCGVAKVQNALHNKKGEFFIDKGVGIIIVVVVGALMMGGVYALMNTTVMPQIVTKVTGLFSFTG